MKIINPLLFITLALSDKKKLAEQILYLKAENSLLRTRLPRHIKTTLRERFILLKYGKPLGSAITSLITIVTPQTFSRWVRQEDKQFAFRPLRKRRTPEQIRALVIRIARDTGWGYTRVLGEVRKLGIRLCRSTVVNIMKAHDINPSPERTSCGWKEYIERHADSLYACDFFSKNVWTPLGLRKFHILALIHIGSRKVRILGISQTPNQCWMVQQAEELVKYFKTQEKPPLLLLHDRDKRLMYGFNPTLIRHGIPVQAITPYSPNLNAHIERWIKSIKEECLNHYIVFGEKHLRYLVNEYVAYYNTLRPHQGKDNKPLTPQGPVPDPNEHDLENIICESRLGGLLKHYRYAA